MLKELEGQLEDEKKELEVLEGKKKELKNLGDFIKERDTGKLYQSISENWRKYYFNECRTSYIILMIKTARDMEDLERKNLTLALAISTSFQGIADTLKKK